MVTGAGAGAAAGVEAEAVAAGAEAFLFFFDETLFLELLGLTAAMSAEEAAEESSSSLDRSMALSNPRPWSILLR
jgi:hypothetical protein